MPDLTHSLSSPESPRRATVLAGLHCAYPVSGRAEPRPCGPEPVHDVRFFGSGLHAECLPCAWRAGLEGGHTLAELARLDSEHAGIVGVVALTPADRATVLDALADASRWRGAQTGRCRTCTLGHACDEHLDNGVVLAMYSLLLRTLGGPARAAG